jgi:hypothetical protein
MEHMRKTTILLTPDLHRRLARLARAGRTSMGELIRQACERAYGGEGSRTLLQVREPVPATEPAATAAPPAPGMAADRAARMRRFLETEVWPAIPPELLDRPRDRRDDERMLGFGPDGV